LVLSTISNNTIFKSCFCIDQQTYQIIGAAIEVHKELGRGFLEAVYQEALEVEFRDREIPFQPQMELPVFYKGRKLKTHYRSDFLCYNDIIVELKALTRLGDGESAQVLNYLKAARRERALLINFGSRSLQHERFVWSNSSQPPVPKSA
jgi:GxxExxY protein